MVCVRAREEPPTVACRRARPSNIRCGSAPDDLEGGVERNRFEHGRRMGCEDHLSTAGPGPTGRDLGERRLGGGVEVRPRVVDEDNAAGRPVQGCKHGDDSLESGATFLQTSPIGTGPLRYEHFEVPVDAGDDVDADVLEAGDSTKVPPERGRGLLLTDRSARK